MLYISLLASFDGLALTAEEVGVVMIGGHITVHGG